MSSTWISAHEQVRPAAEPPIQPTLRRIRIWGVSLGIAVGVVAGLVVPLARDGSPSVWPWLAGLAFAAVVASTPRRFERPYRTWLHIGAVLARWNTFLLLGIVYWALFVPVALVMCYVVRRDPLERTFEPERTSYRKPSRTRQPDTLEKPY